MTDGSISVDTGTDELLYATRDRVAVITLNRPEARNSLSNHLTPALRRMIKRTGDDPEVGALLITGAGTAFCSGGDVKGMGGNYKVARLRERQRTLTGVLVSVRKPAIAALPGPAAGAGLALALACDLRIAAESAVMTTGYARIALTGDYGVSWLLTRLAGTARARELMFLSERLDARRCEILGLVNRVVPDSELQHAAFAIATASKPKNISMEEAASIPLVGLTAWQALVEVAKLKPGQKVFIQAGSGGVGTFAIQLAKHLGAVVAGRRARKMSSWSRASARTWSSITRRRISRRFSLIESGVTRPVVDKIFPFEETGEALAHVETGRAKGKVVIAVKH
jgi:enoyl-CoA hydratase/carnithine racemase